MSFIEKNNTAVIEGANIYLVPIGREDTDRMVRWRNQESVKRYFICQEEFTAEAHNNWLATKVQSGQVKQFIIYVKKENKPIGSVYLRDIDLFHKKAEYGVFIGEEAWQGKGLGTETAKLMIDYAFRTLHLHKVMLRALASNQRAIASYQRAGFVQEGYLRDEVMIRGEFRDIVLMAIREENEI